MKPISLHVDDQSYEQYRSLSARTGKPIAALIREAMKGYLERERERQQRPSLLDLQPQSSGPLLFPWTRAELYDEMAGDDA